jgi:iron complex outermembrane receptor protein
MKKSAFLLSILSIFITNLAFADDIEYVTVNSSILGLTENQIENPIHVITGEDLSKTGTLSLGESLDNLLGVASSDYGSAVGQPVIRGLSGPRVKVLENGLVIRDVSGIGSDHQNDVELSNVQQIEIVRGPMSLLYSNGSLGGIVNVVDNSITAKDFSEQIINLGVEHNSVNDGKVHNINFSDNLQGVNLSLSYAHSNFNNFEIPAEAVIHEDGHDEEEKDHMSNSDSKSSAYKAGFSVVEDWGYIGLSFKNIENLYGIPFHGEHEDPAPGSPPEEDERIFSSTDSDTSSLKGSYLVSGDLLNKIDYFYSDSDYSLIEGHIGGEEDGEKTTFTNDAKEYGAILDISSDNSLTQKIVMRSMDEDTAILGDEAFMKPVQSEETSIGYYLAKQFSSIHLDFGVRRDEVNRKSLISSTAYDKDIDLTSYVLGLCYELSAIADLNLSFGSVERAPSSVEMFMNGKHAAINRFEKGNPNLQSEEAQNIDLSLNFDNDSVYGSINFYQNDIDNYIYLKDSSATIDGTVVANYLQKDAEFSGYEIQFGTQMDFYNGSLDLSIGRDQVEGTFANGENVLRVLPARVLYSLSYEEDNLSIDLGLTNVKPQNDLGAGETATAGYEMLDFSIGQTFAVEGIENFKVVFFADNLLNEIARNHSSIVKNELPLPGKNLGLKLAIQL